MFYCTRCGFKLFASNYLEIDRHELFNHIKSLLEKARVPPAEVAEQLLKSDEPAVALRDMVTFLADHKSKENEEVNKEKVRQCHRLKKMEGVRRKAKSAN
ncbi:hypothetical protein NL676_006309 [Syzygium grande]|nr:hypothetical protein NL676_006309 [Syzygium grande]